MKMNILLVVILAVFSLQAFAGRGVNNIKIATGGAGGSYEAMGKDIAGQITPENEYGGYCLKSTGGKITLISGPNIGSETTLKGIVGKLYGAGLVQQDVWEYFADKQPDTFNKNNVNVLADLHMEAYHLLIPKDYKPDNGAWSNMFAAKPATMDLTQLKNQTIATWGGSTLSAKALSHFVGLNLRVIGTTKAKALSQTKTPLLIVAGRGSNSVKEALATGHYELVGINPRAVGGARFYKTMGISYQTGGATVEVETIGVRAQLLGKVKSKKKFNKRMINLASCIEHNYSALSDDDSTHPNWQGAFKLNEAGTRANMTYFDNEAEYEGKEADEEE